MALRQTLSTGTSESSIIFFNGGHNHNGVSSALIDVSKYSLYDLTTDFLGTTARQEAQSFNYGKFKEVVARIVKEDVLTIAGIKLLPNEVRAENITAGAITADKLSANIVLVNNVIRSNNFDGTVLANGTITTSGTVGWAISGQGQAVFDTSFIRGSLTASSVSTPGIDIDANGNLTSNASTFGIYANGAIFTSSGNFAVDASGNLYAENAVIYGEINATSGSIDGDLLVGGTITSTDISGVNITGSLITAGSSYFDQYGTLDINGSYDTGNGASGAYRFLIANSAGYPFTMLTSAQGSAQLAGNEFRLNGSFGSGGVYMNNHFTIDANGGLYPDTGAYNSAFFIKQEASGEALSRVTSKREHKKDITSFTDLSLIDELNPVKYKWINGSPNEKEILKQKREQYFDIGFIAEEVAEIGNGELAEYEIINDMAVPAFYKVFDIVALSVANIKDLRTRISSLEARIAELEG
jgi:hypothetical protein